MGSDDEKEVKKEKRKVGLAPIAKPLAGKKLSKKSLKVVKKGEACKQSQPSACFQATVLVHDSDDG